VSVGHKRKPPIAPGIDATFETVPAAKGLIALIDEHVLVLPPEERELVRTIIKVWSESGDDEILAEARSRDYIGGHMPVDPHTFLTDPYFLGDFAKAIYPKWRADLEYVLDPKNQIEQWALVGAQGTGKCRKKSASITLWGGQVVTAEALVGKSFALPTLLNGKVRKARAWAEWNRIEPTFTLETHTGKLAEANSDHPFWVTPRLDDVSESTRLGRRMKLGPAGWQKLKNISPGDLVAIPDSLPVFGTKPLPDHEVKLLAYLIGDGSLSTSNIRFTQTSGPQLFEFLACVKKADAVAINYAPMQYRIVGQVRTIRHHYPGSNPILNLVREHGLEGKLSKEKRIPSTIFVLPKQQLALFLSRLYSTDGWAHYRPKQNGRGSEIGYCTASHGLAMDLMRLLLRFGLHPVLTYRRVSSSKDGLKKFNAWTLTLRAHDQIRRFASEIGIFGKEKALTKIVEHSNRWLNFPRKRKLLKGTKKSIARPCYIPWMYRNALPGTRWEYVQAVTPGPTDMTVAIETESHTFLTEFYEHNTTVALAAQTYKLYRLSCLKDPQRYYSLDPTAEIYFGMFTLNKEKANDVLYNKFHKILEQSNYFKERFPFRKRRKGPMVSGRLQEQLQESEWVYELLFPRNLHVISGSQTAHALSVDLFSCLLDEMNWRRKKSLRPEEDVNSAVTLYEQVLNRITGRFMSHGIKPGLLCVVSSKRATTDFTDGLVARMRKEPEHCFVSDYPLWEVKPGKYSTEKFHVFVGGSYGESHIIKDEDLHKYDLKAKNIVSPPVDFLPDFKRSINSAIRDIGGISTVPYSLLFENEEIILQNIDSTRKSPFRIDEIPLGLKTAQSLDFWFDATAATFHDGYTRKPRWHSNAPRFIHVDLSKNRNATGLSMLCPHGSKKIISMTPDRKQAVAFVPQIWVDFTIRIIAPEGDEIDYDKIRQFIVYLRRVGYPIQAVSFDQFQCLAKGTLINTARGLIPIEEVQIGDVVASRSGPRRVQRTWIFGKKDTLKIITRDGEIIEGTGKHRIEVSKKHFQRNSGPVEHEWEWKRLDELKPNDIVRMVEDPIPFEDRPESSLSVEIEPYIHGNQRLNRDAVKEILQQRANGANLETIAWNFSIAQATVSAITRKKIHVAEKKPLDVWKAPSTLTPKLAEWMGLIWGDGHIGERHVNLTVTKEEAEDALHVHHELFGFFPAFHQRSEKTFGEIRLNSMRLVRWLNANTLVKPFIPDSVLRGSRAAQAAFLRGLFAADGSVSKDIGQVTLSTKHAKLAKQVMVLLRTEFGIASHLTLIRGTGGGCVPYSKGRHQYVVQIRGSRKTFLEQIGFSYQRKAALLAMHVNRPGRRIFSRVAKIKPSQAQVYDLQVEDDPSYTANGFISHNSVDSMQLLTKTGFTTNYTSVDRSDLPYVNLRNACSQKRLNIYRYEPLIHELRNLIHDLERSKVDHPDTDVSGGPGSKDVSDSLCGAYTTCAQAVAALKPTTAIPHPVHIGQHETDTEPSEKVTAMFKALGIIPTVTGSPADAFATADVDLNPRKLPE